MTVRKSRVLLAASGLCRCGLPPIVLKHVLPHGGLSAERRPRQTFGRHCLLVAPLDGAAQSGVRPVRPEA